MNEERLKQILVYKKLWQQDHKPILDKAAVIQDFPQNWMTDELKTDLNQGKVLLRTTSGTTSERMQVFLPKDWRQKELTHTFTQHPILKPCLDPAYTRIALTTAVCSQTVCFKEDPGPEQRLSGGTLFLNLSHDPNTWRKADIERMLDEMKQYAPYFLDADPFYLAHFLKLINQFDLQERFVKPKVVTLGYELCTKNVRQYLDHYLNVPVVDIYSSTELGYVLMETEPGCMYLCSRETAIEFIPLDEKNGLYSLIVTATKNPYMPLIRYRTGDCIQTDNPDDTQTLIRFCGREKDIIQTKSGALVPHIFLDDVIAAHCPEILFYQLQYLQNGAYCLYYSTENEQVLNSTSQQVLQEQLSDLLEAECLVHYQQSIPPTHSGKFSWFNKEGII